MIWYYAKVSITKIIYVEITEVWITQKIGKERGQKDHMEDVFLDQKRVNVCEQMVNAHLAQSLPCVHIHLLIEKDICDRRNISSFHVFVCAFRLEIASFFGTSSPFLFLFFN